MNIEIINKIKGLLAKTTDAGCTEHEAQTAVALANRLITQYNISIENIHSTTKEADEDIWGEAKITPAGKWTLDIHLATCIIEKYFFVKGIRIKNGKSGVGRGFILYFYGKKENTITAKYIFDGLMAAFKNLWISYQARTNASAQYRRVFIEHVAQGFADKLKLEREDFIKSTDISKGVSGSTALAINNVEHLVVVKYKKTYPNAKSKSVNFSSVKYNDSVAKAGYRAGRNLNINPQVSRVNKKTLD
jgi:hypothetical protein